MKTSNTLTGLAWLVAALALGVTGAGLFWQDAGSPSSFTTLRGEKVEIDGQGVYRYDTLFAAAGNRGTDAAMLGVGLPLLVVSILLYRRGSRRGAVLLTSALVCFLYYGATLALGAAYNNLFLLYIALFSASLFATGLAMTSIDLPALYAHLSPQAPRRGMAAFMFVAGIVTALLWLSDIAGGLAQGRVPPILASYTTLVTYVLDLGVIVPVVLLTGVLLVRRNPLGDLLAPVMLILCALVGAAVIGQTVFQLRAGISFSPGQLIGLVSSWIIMGLFALGLAANYFRSVAEPTASPDSP